jgi:hypothetical protein
MGRAYWFKAHPSWCGEIMTESVGKSNSEKLADALSLSSDLMVKIAGCSDKAVVRKAQYTARLEATKETIKDLQSLLAQGIDKELGDTCKTRCRMAWIEHETGRRKEVHTKYFDKGVIMEDAAILILSRLDEEFYDKNEETFENEFLIGTPDVIHHKKVMDVKCSWDIFNFFKVKFNKLDKGYEYQLQCYLELLRKIYPDMEDAELCYCLMNTPEHLKAQAIKNAEWRTGEYVALEDKEYAQIERNHTFDDFKDEKRVIRFNIKYDEDMVKSIEKRVQECRKYIETLYDKD